MLGSSAALSQTTWKQNLCSEVFFVGIQLSCCLVLQLPRLPKRGTLKGVHLSQGSVLLSFISWFDAWYDVTVSMDVKQHGT